MKKLFVMFVGMGIVSLLGGCNFLKPENSTQSDNDNKVNMENGTIAK